MADTSDYLQVYKRFFEDFAATLNPDDQLPVKVAGYYLSEAELVGGIIDWTLQYLNQKNCPPSLVAPITKIVIEEIKLVCKGQPSAFRTQENLYEPLKLMQAVTRKVNEVCLHYRDNGCMSTLPPPITGPPISTCAIKNIRRLMEDRHVIIEDFHALFNIEDHNPASYYAVFDGHDGTDAAVYSVSHLHQFLAESSYYPTDPVKALKEAFFRTDSLFIEKSEKEHLRSGTTAVCALLRLKENKLYIAWLGDSQALLVCEGKAVQVVNPHKPDRQDERQRIEDMGGCVLFWGTWRVNGQLAVSRAIGDPDYKPYVSAEPEVKAVDLTGNEDFLILACDGLWDFVTADAAVSVVYDQVRQNPDDLEAVSQRLVQLSKKQGSTDNISVIIVFLTAPSQLASRPLNVSLQWTSLNNGPQYQAVSSMDSESSTNPFANGASEEVTCPKGLLLDLGTGNDENGFKQNAKKSPELFFLDRPSNGKVTEDDDFGPETDVDAVDDIQLSPCNNNPFNIDDDLRPEQLLDFEPMKEARLETPTPPADEVIGVTGVGSDNVAESGEESEDEWNYYKVEHSGNKTESESKQQINLPVCEKPASLQGITVPSESENMESRLNPNAAEFIPSPTQQRSIEQVLPGDSAVDIDAELLVPTLKTEEGIPEVPHASDSLNSVTPSEKLPDLNGQKDDCSISDVCQLKDISVNSSAPVFDSAETKEISDKPDNVTGLGDIPDSEIPSASCDQGSLEIQSNIDISNNCTKTFEDFLPKDISQGFPQFLDSDVKLNDVTPVPGETNELGDVPLLQQECISPVGNKFAAIGEMEQLKEFNIELDQLQELANNVTAKDDGLNLTNTENVEVSMLPTEIGLVANGSFNTSYESSRLLDEISDNCSHHLDDIFSSRQPVHISFELQKDIAPEMESQPEVVKLNGEDNNASFDIQEPVLEETSHDIDESIENYPVSLVDLEENRQCNLMDANLKEGAVENLIEGNLEVGYMALSGTSDILVKKYDHNDELKEVSQSLSGVSSPVKSPQNKPLSPDHPLNVCDFTLDNARDLEDNIVLSESKEFDVLQENSQPFMSNKENESSQKVELDLCEILLSSDLKEDISKPKLESPVVIQTPPLTLLLPVDTKEAEPNVPNPLDVVETLPEVNKTSDSLEKEGASSVADFKGAAAPVAAVTTVTAVGAGAAVAVKISESKKSIAKKQLPEKAKTISKAPVRSKPVPTKVGKSVPTSPTKPVSSPTVQKTSPKKLPGSVPASRPVKVPSPTTAVTSINKPKSNGLVSKPASLSKSRPPSGALPVSSSSSDVRKASSKRPETVGNKIGTGTSPATRMRPVTATVPAPKTISKPPVSKTTTTSTTRPSSASTNGSASTATKPKVPLSITRPKTVVQSKVTSVKEGKESVNKQISSSRTSSGKTTTTSTVTRTVAQSSTRKVESKLIGNSTSVAKTTATTLKTASGKLGTKKSPSVTSSSSVKSKVTAPSENRESVKEVTSSVITNSEVKCDEALIGNAE